MGFALKNPFLQAPARFGGGAGFNFLRTAFFGLFGLFFTAAFFYLSALSPWTETEIFPLHTSRFLFSENSHGFLFSLKPLFYFALWLCSLFSQSFSLFPMTAGRLLFALNGLLILALVYLCIKKKSDQWNALLGLLILASSCVFLERGFRIRSDLLLASLGLLAWLTALNTKQKAPAPSREAKYPPISSQRWDRLLALLGLLPLLSPKGLYWLFFMPCFVRHELRGRAAPSRSFVVKRLLVFLSGCALLSFAFGDPFFIKAWSEAWLFYITSLKEALQAITEWGGNKSLPQESHLFLFMEENPFLLLLLAGKMFFVTERAFSSKKEKREWSDAGFLILLGILLFHPQKKMFFLCALAPFVVVSFFTDPKWILLGKKHYSRFFKTGLLAGAFLFGGFFVSSFALKLYRGKNTFLQKEMMGGLNAFYKNSPSEWRIFDPDCLLYQRKTDCKYLWDKSGERFSREFESYFKRLRFDVVFANRALDVFRLESLHLPVEESGQEALCPLKGGFPFGSEPLYPSSLREKGFYCLKDRSPPLQKNSGPPRRFLENASRPAFRYVNMQNHIYYRALVFPSDFSRSQALPNESFKATGRLSLPLSPAAPPLSLDQDGKAPLIPLSVDSQEESLGFYGKQLVSVLFSDGSAKIPRAGLRYSYFYLDPDGRPLNSDVHKTAVAYGAFKALSLMGGGDMPPAKICARRELLRPGVAYSLSAFKRGWIPFQEKPLALFYLPFPRRLPQKPSLRILFRYDLY